MISDLSNNKFSSMFVENIMKDFCIAVFIVRCIDLR